MKKMFFLQYRTHITLHVYLVRGTCLSLKKFESCTRMVSSQKLKPNFSYNKIMLCRFQLRYQQVFSSRYFLSFQSPFFLMYPPWTPLQKSWKRLSTPSLERWFNIRVFVKLGACEVFFFPSNPSQMLSILSLHPSQYVCLNAVVNDMTSTKDARQAPVLYIVTDSAVPTALKKL